MKSSNLFRILVFTLFLGSSSLFAQELNCQVKIIAPQLTSTDQSVIQTLETSISEFMNNRKWTNDVFEPHEKIGCNLVITIEKENGTGNFTAKATIQSFRPVFNSDYQSVLFNHLEKNFDFSYAEFQPLEYNENMFISNLTSMLAFYAHLIIGIDYDSYGLKGGAEHFSKAQAIVNTSGSNQNAKAYKGWEPFQDNLLNRFHLIEKFTDGKYSAIREVYYQYHILGLDKMYENPKSSLPVFTNCLKMLEKLKKSNPNFSTLQVFFSAKVDELIEIYKGASGREKVEGVNILIRLDGQNAAKYQAILKN